MHSCKYVRPQDLHNVWYKISDYLQSALDYSLGEQSLDDVYNKILENKYRLFVILKGIEIKGCCVVSLEISRVKVFNIVLLGGESFDEWSHYLSILEEEGKRQGVDFITLYGRPGWLKKLKPMGFKPQSIVMSKRL